MYYVYLVMKILVAMINGRRTGSIHVKWQTPGRRYRTKSLSAPNGANKFAMAANNRPEVCKTRWRGLEN
jgi:hypothetical protein